MRYTLCIMNSSDDIIFEDAKNLSDDTSDTNTTLSEEEAQSSMQTLVNQGVFLERTKAPALGDNPDNFSAELKDISGIEILPSEDEDPLLP